MASRKRTLEETDALEIECGCEEVTVHSVPELSPLKGSWRNDHLMGN